MDRKASAQTPALPTFPDGTEADLVLRAQCGDREAFSELYGLYCPKIYSYVLRHVGGDPEVAQDLTSDVFLKAMEHIGMYRFQNVPFTSWLFRIAHNHIVDYYRRVPKQPPVTLEDDHGPAKSLDVSMILNRKVLHDAIGLLTPEQRNVVVRRLINNQSVAETARAMGRTPDAVKQLQRRALDSLWRILQTPTLAPLSA